MSNSGNSKVAILATSGFEQSELFSPRDALEMAGAAVHVVSPDGPSITGWDSDNWGEACQVDVALTDANPADYDALVLPGGVMNPDQLRINEEALSFVRSFIRSGKVVAAICHAPWILISAGAVAGRNVTSYPSVRDDLESAGANWHDKPVVIDNGVITSRKPGDLDAFNAAIIREMAEGKRRRAA